MAGRGHDGQLEAARPQDVAVAEVVVAAAHRADGRPGQLGEPGRGLGVVDVPVGEHRLHHPRAPAGDVLEDGRQVRPRRAGPGR